MTSLLAIFLISFAFSFLLSPLTGKIGTKYHILDSPDYRKPQQEKIPRTGGTSIFLAFIASLIILAFFGTRISDLLFKEHMVFFFTAGAAICFFTGLVDDFVRLNPWIKLFLQSVAALIAFAGGMQITSIPFLGGEINGFWVSLLATMFWFLLLINAVNLIDGLDGLAGGITLFTCLAMTIFLLMDEKYQMASLFLILAGTVSGFLPYNFSRSRKIYLGDSGSYFLGYCVAFFSISGSVKSHVSATMLIPLLAMGLPVFEAIFSPLRRIILAKNPLRPDNGHIHHHLLKSGFTSRKALLILYSFTVLMCLLAITLVTAEDERSGLLLIIIGIVAAVFLKNTGYFNYIDKEKCISWLSDFSFVTGMAKDRRRFLNLQIAITESGNIEELWKNICEALNELDMDFAEINIRINNPETLFDSLTSTNFAGQGKYTMNKVWYRNNYNITDASLADKSSLFKMEMPLRAHKIHIGQLCIIKDLSVGPMNHYTLTRIEHMRRSIERSLRKWLNQG